MARAIHQALFLETNLTPTRKREALRNAWPVGGGDTIRITLQFTFENVNYTVTKQWGTSSSSELKNSEGIVITDSKAVQKQIIEILPANQAVVEQVLISSQSQLADAVDKLSGDVQSSLSDQLRAAILNGGGISAAQLEETIRAKAASFFGRWDEGQGTIEGGASRGLANRWKNGVGHIANAWYEWQAAVEEEKAINTFEIESNRLQAELNKCNEELKGVTTFLNEYKAVYDSINKRIVIEGEILKFQTALDTFAKDAQRWPTALAELTSAQDYLKSVDKELIEVKQELDIARQKADALKDLEKLARINELSDKIGAAEFTLTELVEIPEVDLALAAKLQSDLTRFQALIDGQKLRFTITPSIEGVLAVTHSGGLSEALPFQIGQITEKEVSGSVAFEWQGIAFIVQSANEDIATLESSLNKTLSNKASLLGKYNLPSIEAMATTAERYKTGTRLVKETKSNLQAALGQDSLDSLKARCEKAATLPGTRDLGVLEELWERFSRLSGEHHIKVTNLQKEIVEFEKKHISLENLDERRLNGKQSVRDKEKELGLFPTLPDGFASAMDFQKQFAEAIAIERSESDKKHFIELSKQALKEPDISLSDVKDKVIIARATFEKSVAEGNAYRRVQNALADILSSANNNAFKPLHKKTEAYLEQLSAGRFKHIPFDVTQPQRLIGDNVALPVELLSKGTKDILALSLRLAAANVYLEIKSGFVIMDDPLVDMDRTRREASSSVIKEFASNHQTIIFTCHEAHAALLCEAQIPETLITV